MSPETWDGETHEFHANRDGTASMLGSGTLRKGDKILIQGWEGGDVLLRITGFDPDGKMLTEPADD